MNTTVRNRQSPKGLLIAGTLMVLLAVGAMVMKAFNPQPDPPGIFGMIGVTPSDTMRLNVVNMEFPGIPPGPCHVTLKFIDERGGALKAQKFTVQPTQSALLDITGLEAGGGFRTQVHPVMALSSSDTAGCSAVASVEVFNSSSGETTVFTHPIFIPPPSAAGASHASQ